MESNHRNDRTTGDHRSGHHPTHDDPTPENLTPDNPAGGDPEALAAFVRRVRGPVFLPGDDGFDAERSGFQLAYRHRPAVIVGAEGADDVAAAVDFAAGRGLPVAVQATGHGLSVATDGGLLISTRRMAAVRVDPVAGTARVGAGAVWEQVIEAAAPYGLAPLNGSAPGVGVVGYTLGGGVGVLARTFGFAADRVRAVELVMADARRRRVTADSDPELFGALLGGGHGFGVVTAMEFGLLPVARLYGGRLVFGADRVEDALAAYVRWTETVPDELTSSVALIAYPDIPQLPAALRGRHLAQIRIAYTGSVAEGERLVAPLRAVGPRVSDELREMPYAESHTIHQDPSDPHAYLGDNALLSGVDAAALRRVAALTGPAAPVMCVVQLNHLGGALTAAGGAGRRDAVGHRDARFALRLLSPLDAADPAADQETARALHAEALAAVAPWTVGRSVNFLFGGGGSGDWTDAEAAVARGVHEADAHRRLTALRAVHDPAGLFRFHPSALPGPRAGEPVAAAGPAGR
ncbi:FAD-binding oxidoreductase [Streptomyces celluloflavus]|uniref:FAD-binding oxidoreductase n=1 Tax=Streptomyces celluloflavus TaxID=58344 RepID=UPI00345F3DA3|nr:FAD-binding oxidoreductase [Streptomyces celluloflavus]